MRRLLAAAVVVFVLTMAASVYTQTPAPSAVVSRPSYTTAQAERGKAVYVAHCSTCHLENLAGRCPEAELSSASYVCGATGNAPPLVGVSFMKRFHSVGDLYSRVKWTMPLNRQNSLSTADYLNVVAYLLQANAVRAAGQELRAGNALKTMLLNDAGSDRMPAVKVSEPLNSVGISRTYYTETQAERGRGYFYGSCGFCHTAEPGAKNGTMPRSSGLGWHRGAENSFALFVGDRWLSSVSGIPGRPQRWSTVADLYNKIHTTQPAYDVAGLSSQTYLDVLAFLLKQNDFPSGNQELTADISQMRNMTLESGFERLFNGKDLTGWGFVVGVNCKPRPEGCGDNRPGTTFRVEKGTVLNTGTPHGYMYTQKKYWNFTLRFEYLMEPREGMESDDDLFTNTGYFLFVNDHDVWPATLEIQGKNDFEMSLALGAAESTFKFDDAARARARKPAGQWNAAQIVAKDGEVWTYLNGVLVTHVTKHPFTEAGHIGFQVESGPVRWRNIRIRPN